MNKSMDKHDEEIINDIYKEEVMETKEPMSVIENELPEAPMSIHIDTYYKGFHSGITIRMTDNTTIPTSKIMRVIDSLINSGFQPSWNVETNNAHITPVKEGFPNDTIGSPKAEVPDITSLHQPSCPKHGMTTKWKEGTSKKTGNPYAFWGCTSRNQDGSYCNAELVYPES